MTLTELSVSYYEEAETLRLRIRQVREQPARGRGAQARKEDRMRLLTAMYRDTRAMAELCSRYYDRSYRPREEYRI